MVASSIMKMTFLPGKRSFANAKAAMEEVRVLKAITEKVITQLFLIPVSRLAALHTSR